DDLLMAVGAEHEVTGQRLRRDRQIVIQDQQFGWCPVLLPARLIQQFEKMSRVATAAEILADDDLDVQILLPGFPIFGVATGSSVQQSEMDMLQQRIVERIVPPGFGESLQNALRIYGT